MDIIEDLVKNGSILIFAVDEPKENKIPIQEFFDLCKFFNTLIRIHALMLFVLFIVLDKKNQSSE